MTSHDFPLNAKREIDNIEPVNPMLRNITRLARWLTSRMGSLTPTTRVQNEDTADQDVALPSTSSWLQMLNFCQKKLRNLPPKVERIYLDCPLFLSSKEVATDEVITLNCDATSDLDGRRFRVLQWNILSQALGEVNDNFVACPDDALSWSTRRWRLLEEIVSARPDILCLQEVDHFRFLEKTLGSLGFRGIFSPKPDSPCLYVAGNNGPDGCAIFWNDKCFELCESQSKVLEVWGCNSNQVALMVVLRIRKAKDQQDDGCAQRLTVVTTHLKARQGNLLTALRHEQGKDLLRWVRDTYPENSPLILAGDFNAEPTEPVYRTILGDPKLQLISSYATTDTCNGNPAGEPPYTTWKIREEGEVCHTIDYLFYSRRHLELRRILALPSGEDIGPQRVPSYQYPSDHFSMVAEFCFASRNDKGLDT